MKNLIILLLVVLALKGNTQIVFERTYPNLSFNTVYIGPSGYKYALVDTGQIQLYNLDHSLFTSFAIPPAAKSYGYNVFLITENLFDRDSANIEYLVDDFDNYPYSVKVFRNDGAQIFNEDSVTFVYPGFAAVNPLLPVWNPIAVTDSGIKMVLLNESRDRVKVYSLPGTLSKCCCDAALFTEMGNFQQENYAELKNYPNPSSGQTTIEYSLPNNITSCDLVIYNMNGTELKRYMVTSAFSNLVLKIEDLPSGTYYYQLQAESGFLAGKKMVIIK